MDGWVGEMTDWWVDNGWMDGWVEEWMVDGWMGGWMGGKKRMVEEGSIGFLSNRTGFS
jgi:hypothetical protein